MVTTGGEAMKNQLLIPQLLECYKHDDADKGGACEARRMY